MRRLLALLDRLMATPAADQAIEAYRLQAARSK